MDKSQTDKYEKFGLNVAYYRRMRKLTQEQLASETVKVYSRSLERFIYKNNGVPYIIATGEESYGQLAKEYNLFTKELLRFNDLHKTEEKPAHGTVVYIAKKKGRCKESDYIATEGDTPYSVSQKAGIRLKSLCKLNGLTPESALEPGSRIKLRR